LKLLAVASTALPLVECFLHVLRRRFVLQNFLLPFLVLVGDLLVKKGVLGVAGDNELLAARARLRIRSADIDEPRMEAVDAKIEVTGRAIAVATMPELITLVPEKREELTTEGGFAIERHFNRLVDFLEPIKGAGIEISLFIEAEQRAIDLAEKAGADLVELHTGAYALKTGEEQAIELKKIRQAAVYAKSLGLRVVAGHGLNYENIAPFRDIEEIEEVSIGHALIARAAFVGIPAAVREMLDIIN